MSNPFLQNDQSFRNMLSRENAIIELNKDEKSVYLNLRYDLSNKRGARSRPFVAVALRQFLSSWGQFKKSAAYAEKYNEYIRLDQHPKVETATKLVEYLLNKEKQRLTKQGYIGKILIFTTYVGAEREGEVITDENSYGTAMTLVRHLSRVTSRLFKSLKTKESENIKQKIREELLGVIESCCDGLNDEECNLLKKKIDRFAGTRMAVNILRSPSSLKKEKKHLEADLNNIGTIEQSDDMDEEHKERINEHKKRQIDRILQRYTTRRIVARYDGAIKQEDKDRHLHGFNSPFSPLVLIASSVARRNRFLGILPTRNTL